MALSAKPPRPAPAPTNNIEAFINKGGSAPAEAAPKPMAKGAQHPLKFPEGDLFERLEKARKSSAVKLPRNTWILQAIAEKLEREGI
jgi:hypothetical protein